MSNQFVHLHVHTEFSVLDGLGTVQDYVSKAKELGMPALAITDHGNVCGAPQFYHACRKVDIEPLIGEEFYFTANLAEHLALKGKSVKGEGMEEEAAAGLGRYHFVLVAKGAEGYRVLSELSTLAHSQFYYKPLLDRSNLEALGDDAKHLVALTGCAASIISKAVQSGDQDRIRDEFTWWRETFPHLYTELQHHDTDFDRELNRGLVRAARKYDIPWVVTNDPHYVVPEDECHHDTLLAVQTASDIDDPDRFRFSGTGYHLRTRAEMRRAFAQYGESIWKPGAAETLRIAKACRTRIPLWESRTWQIPKLPWIDDAYQEVLRLTKEGMRAKGKSKDPVYRARARHELKVIKETGVSDFLIVTWESIQEARRRGIPVGPGRGSVCGTLVGYFMGLHKIDSVRYDLLFERFLNPARPRMPDIDTDFGQERRGELFEWAEERFGRENVVHVAAYQSLKLKGMFQQLAKAYGVSYPERIRLSKQFSNDDDPEDILPEELQKAFPELAAQLTRLMGIKRAISNHPAGVIIASPEMKLRQQVPEMWIPNTKKWVGQYDLDAVEEMGLMKQDFLGLKTLDVVATCVALINERTGEELDPDSWVPDEEPDDDKVYAMLAQGRTAGVFQMTGPANQRGCRDVEPENFEDVVSVTSLYRTGAISAGFPKIFNQNRKKGRRHIKYVTPHLKPILERTWGVVLYQEQVMEIGKELAGFTMTEVDDIKEAIKHKKSDLMQSMKPRFIEGCRETHGIKQSVAEEVWRMIEGYSGYGYNRSHAVAYTFLTYQTARLKCLYPLDFIAAQLRHESDKDKRDVFLREAIEAEAKILPPDINVSGRGVTPDVDAGGLRFGLQDIKSIGEKQADKLLEGRPEDGYTSVEEVAAAVRNEGVMKALAAAGALESLGVEVVDIEEQEAFLGWSFHDPMERYRKKLAKQLRLPNDDDDEEDVLLAGMIYNITRGMTKPKKGDPKPYATWKIRWSVTESFDVRLWSETQELWDLPMGTVILVSGKWDRKFMNCAINDVKRVRVIKRGRECAAADSGKSAPLRPEGRSEKARVSASRRGASERGRDARARRRARRAR